MENKSYTYYYDDIESISKPILLSYEYEYFYEYNSVGETVDCLRCSYFDEIFTNLCVLAEKNNDHEGKINARIRVWRRVKYATSYFTAMSI